MKLPVMYSAVILMAAYGKHLTAVKQMWQLANLLVMLFGLLCNTFSRKSRWLPTLWGFARVQCWANVLLRQECSLMAPNPYFFLSCCLIEDLEKSRI